MQRSESPNFAIDIKGWQGKTPDRVHEDIASFALEAGDRSPGQRINTVVLNPSGFGNLVRENSREAEDIATKKIFEWAQQARPAIEIQVESPSDEIEVLNSLCSFTDTNPGTVMVWISPPVEKKYDEARIVIYQTIWVNGQKYLFFRAICSRHTPEECLRISRQLRPFVSTKPAPFMANSEQLTATPLPVTIPKNQTYTGFFSQIVDLPEVWQAIAQGEDLKEKIEALKKTEAIVNLHYQSITQAGTFQYQWLVGSQIEQLIQKKMNLTLLPGPCGELYSNFTSFTSTSVFGIFGVEIDAKNLPVSSGREGKKYVYNCGNCGAPINMEISKGYRCPCCGGVYEGC